MNTIGDIGDGVLAVADGAEGIITRIRSGSSTHEDDEQNNSSPRPGTDADRQGGMQQHHRTF